MAEQVGSMKKCDAKVEVYTRVVGFMRPVQVWNRGKREEYKDRVPYTGVNAPMEGN